MADEQLILKVHREITLKGLRTQQSRLENARANLSFYEGCFQDAPTRPKGNTAYDSARYPRYSLIMQRIVNVLTSNLYSEGPIRKFVPPDGSPDKSYEAATSWIQECYRRNRMDSVWQIGRAHV